MAEVGGISRTGGNEHHISFAIDLVSGVFGGCAGVLAGHPLVSRLY